MSKKIKAITTELLFFHNLYLPNGFINLSAGLLCDCVIISDDAPLIASNDPIETARLSKIPVYALPSTTNQQFDQILKAILENSKDKKKTKIFPFDDFDSNEFKSFMFNPDRFGYKCNKLQFDENCMQCYL